jgi:uncharacterized small protein (TIGR04563 family)
MAASEKQKQSLYFPEDTLREIMTEANRLDRSLSWTVQQAWRLAREGIRKFPSVDRRGEAGCEPLVSRCATGRPLPRMPSPLICVARRLRSASSSGKVRPRAS